MHSIIIITAKYWR